MARIKAGAGNGAVRVKGLRELSRALKSIEPGLQKELRGANKEAAEFVKDKSYSKAMSLGSTAAHVAPSLKASAGAQFAAVAGGGAAHPAFGGAEFGGRGRPTTQQFQPHRGSGPGAGYFVYPTIRDHADEIVEPYEKAIDDLLRKAGLA